MPRTKQRSARRRSSVAVLCATSFLGVAIADRPALADPGVVAYGAGGVPPAAYTAPPPSSRLPPSIVEVRGSAYPATVSAMRDYVESLRVPEPELYAKLDPSLSSLESRRTAAWAVALGGLATGIAVIILARPSAPLSDTTGFLIGGSVIAAGGVVGYFLYPGEGAVESWVEEHNRISPSEPMRFRVSFAPRNGGGVALLSLDWLRW